MLAPFENLIRVAVTLPLFALAPVPLLLFLDTVVDRRRRYYLTKGYTRFIVGLTASAINIAVAGIMHLVTLR